MNQKSHQQLNMKFFLENLRKIKVEDQKYKKLESIVFGLILNSSIILLAVAKIFKNSFSLLMSFLFISNFI